MVSDDPKVSLESCWFSSEAKSRPDPPVWGRNTRQRALKPPLRKDQPFFSIFLSPNFPTVVLCRKTAFKAFLNVFMIRVCMGFRRAWA